MDASTILRAEVKGQRVVIFVIAPGENKEKKEQLYNKLRGCTLVALDSEVHNMGVRLVVMRAFTRYL